MGGGGKKQELAKDRITGRDENMERTRKEQLAKDWNAWHKSDERLCFNGE